MSEKLFTEFPEITTQQWKEKIIKDLKGTDPKKLINKTDLGLDFEPFYREEDLKEIPFVGNIPGKFPFVRGTKQDNNWKIRQDIIVDDVDKANIQAVKLLSTGVTSICYCFNDRHVSEIADLSILLQNIDIVKTEVSFKYQDDILQLQELFILYVKLKNIDVSKIKGSFYYNPYESLLNTGQLPNNENDKLENLSNYINTNAERLGKYGAVNIAADVFKNAGSTVTQEIAYALSQAVEYINKYTEFNNNPIEKILERIEFTFATGGDYFLEIAKYRAMRFLWAKIVKEFGVNDTNLQKIKMNAISTNWNKTIYDAYVNMLRVTTETMSAAIGGCNSISVVPFDNTYKVPEDFSYHIAKNTQIILKEESYFDKIVDPAGGSYYIEKLTKEIASKSFDLFLDIEEKGGFYSNIINGNIQTIIEYTAKQKNKKIEQGQISILGTNTFPNQIEFANKKIKSGIRYKDLDLDINFNILHKYRGAEAFEELRLKTEKSDKTPSVFLYNTGNIVMSKARAMFASGFFACAGFKIIESELSLNIEEGTAEIKKQNPDIVVVCSSDAEYADVVPELRNKFNSDIKLVVAGYPKDLVEKFKEIGVTDFIHVKSNILETLTKFQNEIL
jgi:methylmalonyl-CoA mutase